MPTIREQLEIVTGAFGYEYGPGAMHEWVLNQLSAALSGAGLSDIRELALRDDVYSLGACAIPHKTWVNLRTNEPLPFSATIGGDKYLITRGVTEIQGHSSRLGIETPGLTKCAGEQDGYYVEKRVKANPAIGEHELFESIGRWAGDGRDTDVSVYAKFTDDGVPYFLVARAPHRSSRDTFKQFLSLAVVAASFVIPGLGPTLASGLFGSFAAAYPAVATALTNVALQTALNGGDIGAAVERVAANTLSGGFGNFVQGVSDSAAIGALSNVAMNAAVRGESVADAVQNAALTLAPAALSDVQDFFSSDEVNAIEDPQSFASDPAAEAMGPNVPTGETAMSIFDIPAAAPSMDWDVEYQASIALPDIEEMATWAPAVTDIGVAFDNGSVPLNAPMFEPVGYSLDDLFENATGQAPVATPVAADGTGGALPEVVAQSPGAVDAPASSFFDEVTWDDTVENLTDLAIAAIRVHQAYQVANRPPVQPVMQTTRTGVAQTARSDGTLATADPVTGRAVITRPPAGVPYALPDGGALINNGNGTYTTISPSGSSVTRPYAADVPLSGVARVQPAAWVDGVPNWAIIAASLGALLVATRR